MSVRETPRGSDENLYSASSDSFWDIGNFKRTVKRIDDGAKLCDEFMKLVTERAEIELKYSFKLKAWSKKWEECLRNGPEYASMEAAMLGCITEAESRADLHMRCRDKLMEEVHEVIKKWKNGNYHKGLFQWKETKEADEGFTRAQKPWAKRLAKVERSKKAFHNASRNAEQALKQENEASHDTEKSAEKVKKLQELSEKAKKEMERCKDKYQLRLEEITSYNSQYERDMIQEFEKCQEFEEKRLVFFKDILMQYHKCLDISESSEFSGLFLNMGLTFQKADFQADLDWWARNHGMSMPQNWPVFEEWTLPLSKSGKKTRLHGKSLVVHDNQSRHVRQNGIFRRLWSRTPDTRDSLQRLGIRHLDMEPVIVPDINISNSINLLSFQSDAILQEESCNVQNPNSTRLEMRDKNNLGSVNSEGSGRSCKRCIDGEALYCEIPALAGRASLANSLCLLEAKQVDMMGTMLKEITNGDLGSLSQLEDRKSGKEKEYNEVQSSKRPSTSRGHEQAPPSSYTSTQNHVNPDNTDFNDQNDISPVSNFSTAANADYSVPPSRSDEWDIEPPPVADAGIPVRALYDFQGIEEDELNFKEGDILTQLSVQDDQGWCQGRFAGKVGHFPGSYVEPV